MPKRLNDEQLEEMKAWLQLQGVSYKNLHRDFSDARPVVNILKKLYPKLIDPHNYPPRSGTQMKLNNWETLNIKVLTKLGLQQNKQILDKLAKAQPGAIESLLCDIMLLDRKQQNKGDQLPDEQQQLWAENDEVMMVTVTKKIGDALVQVPQKMILYSIYEQALKESQTKDNFIIAAQQKITHLENVIRLKAERIDELCAQLAKVSVRSLLGQNNYSASLEHIPNSIAMNLPSNIPKRVTKGHSKAHIPEPPSTVPLAL